MIGLDVVAAPQQSSLKAAGFPHISKMPRKIVRSSDHEGVMRVRQEYQNAWEADENEWSVCLHAWKMYGGWPGEQWTEEALRYKEKHNMRAAQYNIIKPRVQIFHGSLVADEYDFKYVPIDRQRTSAIEALEAAYYADKEECNLSHHYSIFLHDGCVHLGILEMVVTTEYDPRGNIAFRARDPGRIKFDPYWTTQFDEDCMKAWKYGHMTARQIKARWPNLPSSPRLDAELMRLKKAGMKWDELTLDSHGQVFPSLENAFHVVEAHWIEEIRMTRIIARGADGRWIPFPATKDTEILEEYAQQIGVSDWQDGAQEVPYTDKVHWQAVICPDLFPAQFIEYGKPEVQIKRLPFFQFTWARDYAGRNQGLALALADAQIDLNYSISKKQDILATQAGGAIMYNRRVLPDESEQQDFERNHNDVGRAFGIDGDVKGFMGHVASDRVSPDVQEQTQQAFSLADSVVNVTPAMQAEAPSGEPASLYAMKLRQSRVGQRTVDDRVKYVRAQMALAYYEQAKITYAGAERWFTSHDGTKQGIFNAVLPDGQVLNKIDAIPRCSVSISEAAGNLSAQMRDREELAAVIKAMPPDGYREHFAILMDKLLATTNVGQVTQDEIAQATSLERIKARISSIAEISTAIANKTQGDVMTMQLQHQLDQMMQAQQQAQQPQGETPMAISPPDQGGGVPSAEGFAQEPSRPEDSAPMQVTEDSGQDIQG